MGCFVFFTDLKETNKKKERFGRSVQPHRLYILQKKNLNKKTGKAFYALTRPPQQTAITQTFNNRKQKKQN